MSAGTRAARSSHSSSDSKTLLENIRGEIPGEIPGKSPGKVPGKVPGKGPGSDSEGVPLTVLQAFSETVLQTALQKFLHFAMRRVLLNVRTDSGNVLEGLARSWVGDRDGTRLML